MYDWANSAFITCITAVILQTYYLSLFNDHEHVDIPVFNSIWHTSGLALWSYTSAFPMLLLIIVAPVLGTIADISNGKKRFLGFRS